MTTCTPDYLHEDLIDCERRGITGDVAPRNPSVEDYLFMDVAISETQDALFATMGRSWSTWAAVFYGWTPPPHPADFPRCEVRL